MKKAIPVLIALVLILIIGGVTFGSQIVEKYTYSQEQADLYEHFHVLKENEVSVILQNELIEEKVIVKDGVYYADLAMVHRYFNDRFYVDEIEQLLLFTTPTEIVKSAIGTTEYLTDQGVQTADYILCYAQASGETVTYYVALDFVKQYTNFSYEVFENPSHMQVYTRWDERQVAEISGETALRVLGGVKSPILRRLAADETVIILDKMETWCKVKTSDAYIGYVENKYLLNERAETPQPVTDYAEPEYTSLTAENKICLGWHAIYAKSGNDTLGEVLANAKGLTVIAPTWFSIKDGEGNLQSFATADYVEKAHNKGVKVWGVVDDFNYAANNGVELDLYTLFATTTKRTQLIDRIMEVAAGCGMDGINIDFEHIDAASGKHFVQFLRELSIRCRKDGLVLSVDNYVPYNFNSYYDLAEQGVVADYVIIMGYDEHWAGSDEAGSVASIGYVRYGIEKTMEYVPSGKIVNALPFYTRLWKTDGTKVSSEAYPMTSVDNVLKTYGMEAAWNEDAGQNYAEVQIDDVWYQMWVEDVQSISVKLNVMQTYDLGGVAAWRLGYEPVGVWDAISGYLSH